MKESNDSNNSSEETEHTKKVHKDEFSKKSSGVSSTDKLNIVSFLIAIVAITTILVIGFNKCRSCFSDLSKKCARNAPQESPKKKYRVYGRNVESGYLHNLFTVLDRLGYVNDPDGEDWDLLWAHDYPFRKLYAELKNLRPHQRVNHFPGCGYITNKVDLATSGLKYIPSAFKLPVQKNKLLDYAAKNPSKLFVLKHNEHRHIKIRNISDIDLDKEGSFVQEFVDKPLLINGYKFDIGIYTIVTSIDPLRVYIYDGDALLRFCPVKYYPFDANNIDKYVVGDDYLPPWDVPDLTYYYKHLKLSMKQTLNQHLRDVGKDPSVIWSQIEDALRLVLIENEPKLLEVANKFRSKENFFEMMRFDFVVDADLNVFLMEANMSPNLSSAHFPPNQHLFEQIIYNLLGLVGIGERIQRDSLRKRVEDEEHMVSADKNIAVFPEKCGSTLCRSSCVSPDCQLCNPCLSSGTKQVLLKAYREHINRGDCKRIFPPQMSSNWNTTLPNFEKYSAENRLHCNWFQGKCLLDSSWCG